MSVEIKMRFIKQSMDIPIKNLDEFSLEKDSEKRRHSDLIPNSLRCIIAGPSGCGKTNLLISLIESENGIKFENLYLCSKTLEQNKYKYLQKILDPIKGVGFYTFSSADDSTQRSKK